MGSSPGVQAAARSEHLWLMADVYWACTIESMPSMVKARYFLWQLLQSL